MPGLPPLPEDDLALPSDPSLGSSKNIVNDSQKNSDPADPGIVDFDPSKPDADPFPNLDINAVPEELKEGEKIESDQTTSKEGEKIPP